MENFKKLAFYNVTSAVEFYKMKCIEMPEKAAF